MSIRNHAPTFIDFLHLPRPQPCSAEAATIDRQRPDDGAARRRGGSEEPRPAVPASSA